MERDERPLDQIQFAADVGDPEIRWRRCLIVRSQFRGFGVKTAQDIVDLGCTGLGLKIAEQRSNDKVLQVARFIREHMAGSICGLPCYVPPDRFCLVHNTIGGLQLQGNVDGVQQNPHPEGVALCSRELTDEEKKHAAVVQKKIDEHAKRLAGEVDAAVTADEHEQPEPLRDRGMPLFAGLRCPEHTEPIWRCRFCLAAAVIAGDFEPMTVIRAIDEAGKGAFADGDKLDSMLADAAHASVELYVRTAIWQRKLVREE